VDRFTDRLQVVQRLRVRLLFALQLHVSRFHRFGQFLRERANGWKNTSRVAARRAEEYASCSPYHYTESHARSQVLRLEGKKYILRGTAPDVPPWLRICRKIERDNTDWRRNIFDIKLSCDVFVLQTKQISPASESDII